jgi:hypothetical protein
MRRGRGPQGSQALRACFGAPCGPQARRIPLERGEIVAVGEAAPCGAARRGVPLDTKGDRSGGRGHKARRHCEPALRAVRACGPRSIPVRLFEQ